MNLCKETPTVSSLFKKKGWKTLPTNLQIDTVYHYGILGDPVVISLSILNLF